MKLRVNRLAAKTSKRPVTDPTGGHRVAEVNLSKYMEIGAWRAPWRSPANPSISFFQPLRRYFSVQHEKGSGCTCSCPKRR